MSSPDGITIIISVSIALLSALAGYVIRIIQKSDDKKDDLYQKELPAIYSDTNLFINALESFKSTGSLNRLSNDIDDIKNHTFSRNIHISDKELQNKLLKFQNNIKKLKTVIEEIKTQDNEKDRTKTGKIFHTIFKDNKKFTYGTNLQISLNDILKEVTDFKDFLEKKIQKYHPYSFKLIVIVIIICVLLGIIIIFAS